MSDGVTGVHKLIQVFKLGGLLFTNFKISECLNKIIPRFAGFTQYQFDSPSVAVVHTSAYIRVYNKEVGNIDDMKLLAVIGERIVRKLTIVKRK